MASIPPPPPPPPPPKSSAASKQKLNLNTVQKAVNGLLKWKKLQNPPALLEQPESDDFIYLLVTLKKIPPKDRTNPHSISLPHPLQKSLSSSELCLIIDDRPKSKPNLKLTSEAAQKKIKSQDLPITKVLKLSKLKSEYRTFEAKQKLYDSYDMFMADKRVVPFLPKLLGKQFFKKKKKVPVPVDLVHGNWKEQIERVCNSTLLCLSSGTCSVVRVGNGSMESIEIVENVFKAIDGVVEVVPKKWSGVRSFHLKVSESQALPIYDSKLIFRGDNISEEKIANEEGSLSIKKRGIRAVLDGKVEEDELLSGNEDDENEGEKIGNNELSSVGFVGKKRKEANLVLSGGKLVR